MSGKFPDATFHTLTHCQEAVPLSGPHLDRKISLERDTCHVLYVTVKLAAPLFKSTTERINIGRCKLSICFQAIAETQCYHYQRVLNVDSPAAVGHASTWASFALQPPHHGVLKLHRKKVPHES